MDNKVISEYTSYELSKRLHDKGFAIGHASVWVRRDGGYFIHGIYDDFKGTVPAYTFTELWGGLTRDSRWRLLEHMMSNAEREDMAELTGEIILDKYLEASQ
jgi:hypothetical protein